MAIVKAMATVPPWDGADAIVVVFVSFARSLGPMLVICRSSAWIVRVLKVAIKPSKVQCSVDKWMGRTKEI